METLLQEPTTRAGKETAPWFLERLIAAHTVTKGNGDTADTVVKCDSEVTDYKLQPRWKSVFELPYDVRSKIERALAYLGVVTRNDVEGILEKHLAK